ncbi:MAG: InlB B-repeat-containing protein, partial [Lachnospiraceae bacterium]|nr:InlB B-repeat-containing protein [Lachnospiraceae bacterium]
VTFDYNEHWKYDAIDLRGNEKKEMIVTFGETATLPQPERYGYRFVGWASGRKYDEGYGAYNGDPDSDLVLPDSVWTLVGNRTLYALWQALKVKVVYDYNYEYTAEVPLP